MKTFLVTGATGFLGSHLVHRLLTTGANVIGIKRQNSSLERIRNLIDNENLFLYDVSQLESAFNRKIDAVFHTACSYGRKSESVSEVIEANISFGLRLIELASMKSVESFFNIDTLLPKNTNRYSFSKKQFIEWIKYLNLDIQFFNMRLEQMYGKNDDNTKLLPWFIEQLENNEPTVRLTAGMQKRDFIYVNDVIDALKLVYDHRSDFKTYQDIDVGTGSTIAVKDFLDKIYFAYKQIHKDNTTVLDYGAIPYRNNELMEVKEDISILKNLGFNPSLCSSVSGIDLIKLIKGDTIHA